MTNLFLWLFILGMGIFYYILITSKYGVIGSISASYNYLETQVSKSLYSWFIFGVAVPMMLLSNNAWGWWAGAFLAIDFAAPTGGDKLQHTLHCIGADVGMGLGVAMLWIVWGMWWLTVPAIVIVALLYILGNYKIKGKIWVKNETWWIEWFVYAVVMVGMFIERVI